MLLILIYLLYSNVSYIYIVVVWPIYISCLVEIKKIQIWSNFFCLRYKDKPWFDDQWRHALGFKQEAYLLWTRDRSWLNWEEFVRCQVKANETYSEAKRQFSDRNRAVLMNVQSPHKWWSTLKSTVFGTSSSLPTLVSEGRLIWCRNTFFIASGQRRPLISCSLAIRLPILPPLPSGQERSGVSC